MIINLMSVNVNVEHAYKRVGPKGFMYKVSDYSCFPEAAVFKAWTV